MKIGGRVPHLHTTVTALLLFLLTALLLFRGDLAAGGVRAGLSLCFETLFPTLFPFLVLSELLVARRVGAWLNGWISRPVSWLFGISGQGASALFMGILCGAPVGTVTASALYRRGEITREELGRLMLLVNNPSPGFLIGAVGGAMMGSTAVGAALFLITWLSAATVGIALRLLRGSVPQITALPTEEAPPPSVGELTGCVTRALASLFRIFAFIIFFSCISTCLLPIVTDCGLPELWGVLLCGLLEMTAGINRAVTALAPTQALCATALLAGFSGLSVCLQVFSITEGEGFPILPYLGARLAQGGIALLLCMGYLRLFSPTVVPTDSLAVFAQNPLGQRHLLGTSLLLLLLLLGASLQKRKKGGGRSRRR